MLMEGKKALLALSFAIAGAMAPSAALAGANSKLEKLFKDWRAFVKPDVTACIPDYSAGAMAAKAKGLEDFKARLAAIDTKGWPQKDLGDARLLKAEMNGMDYDLRVLKPFARDPGFYASVFGEESDVPDHEGPSAFPAIDLYKYKYPLSKRDQKDLTCLLGAVPALFEQAKENLKDSNARDLWLYSERTFRFQSVTLDAFAKSGLSMRTLEGAVKADLTGADEALIKAIAEAKQASDSFRDWIIAETPAKTGPSGPGVENYDWHAKNVLLSPYSWQEQVTLLRRELERSRTALAVEEFRNRDLPPLDPVDDAEEWNKMAFSMMKKITDFMIEGGIVEDKDYFRAAMNAQIGEYTPPEDRNFFAHGLARDPSGLYSHDYHWIELAMRKFEPNKDRIRAATPVFDIYEARSEGMATAMEELLLHAGFYDDHPRGREIIWMMLANRAARGLASLYVQANEMTLEEAGEFHGRWTPRGWADSKSDLVAFEQLLYLRQPGYGAAYITGKMELDRLISDYAFDQEQKGAAFSLPGFFRKLNESGIVPFAIIERDMTDEALTKALPEQ